MEINPARINIELNMTIRSEIKSYSLNILHKNMEHDIKGLL